MKLRNGIAALVLGMAISLPAVAQEAPQLIPHRAVYSLGLLEASVGEVTSMEGILTFDVTQTCTSWDSEGEMTLRINIGGAQSTELVNTTILRESLDGTALQFESSTEMDGSVIEATGGIAQQGDGEEGVIRYTMPRSETVAMPAETLFPTAAAQATLRDFFNGGERISTYFYFDGRPDGAVRATDLAAGTAAAVPAELEDQDGLLAGEPIRLVTTFFSIQGGDSIPGSTIIGDMLPSGVMSQLVLEVGFIKMIGTLQEVSAHDLPDC